MMGWRWPLLVLLCLGAGCRCLYTAIGGAVIATAYVAHVVSTPVNAIQLDQQNHHFVLSGEVVDEQGRPVEGVELAIYSPASHDDRVVMGHLRPALIPLRATAPTTQQVLPTGRFYVNTHGRHVMLWFGKPGHWDSKVIFYPEDAKIAATVGPTTRPVMSRGGSTSDAYQGAIAYAQQHAEQLQIVLPRHISHPPRAVEGELRVHRTEGWVVADVLPGPVPSVTFGRQVGLAEDQGSPRKAVALPSIGLEAWFDQNASGGGAATTRPARLTGVYCLCLTGINGFQLAPAGVNLDSMVRPPLDVVATRFRLDAAPLDLSDLVVLPAEQQQKLFYCRVDGRYARGRIALTSVSDQEVTARLRLEIQDDTSRCLE